MNALTHHLRDYLDEDISSETPASLTTLLHHGQVAQQWLLTEYLSQWLELLGGLVTCDYPLARKYARPLRAASRLRELIDPASDLPNQIFFLRGIEDQIKSVARACHMASGRSMQWGVWAREVPMAMAYGFAEADVLSPLICEGIAPCCMYAAFLTSQVVTDEGAAEEIAGKMFEAMPRELLALLSRLPAAPEA